MRMFIVCHTSAPPITLQRYFIAAAAPAAPSAIPKMRASNVLNHMTHGRGAILGFVTHCRSWAHTWSLTAVTHNTWATIDMSIEWVSEIS